jgi:hypothetical protein
MKLLNLIVKRLTLLTMAVSLTSLTMAKPGKAAADTESQSEVVQQLKQRHKNSSMPLLQVTKRSGSVTWQKAVSILTRKEEC